MIDQPVANFSLPATSGKLFSLAEHAGAPLLLYFYPRDNTPGCTTETTQFRDLHADFAALGCRVYGVSRDSLKSHENFKARLVLPFELLSDIDEKACQIFGVIKEKKLYGKLVRGVERSSFFIDAHGVLRQEWRAVKADGHAAAVLQALHEQLR